MLSLQFLNIRALKPTQYRPTLQPIVHFFFFFLNRGYPALLLQIPWDTLRVPTSNSRRTQRLVQISEFKPLSLDRVIVFFTI